MRYPQEDVYNRFPTRITGCCINTYMHMHVCVLLHSTILQPTAIGSAKIMYRHYRYYVTEIVMRLLLIYFAHEFDKMEPRQWSILKEEWRHYSYPTVKHSGFTSGKLFGRILILLPFVLTIMNSVFGQYWKMDLVAMWLASSLAITSNRCLTNLLKFLVGKPSPDFMYQCFPDGNFPEQPTFEFNCTSSRHRIHEALTSFPSGHCSASTVTLGLCSFYIAGKLCSFTQEYRGHTWRLLAALLPIILAVVLCIGRINTNDHHWQDVFVGSFMGFTISYTCYRQYYPQLSYRECGIPNIAMDEVKVSTMDNLRSVKIEYYGK